MNDNRKKIESSLAIYKKSNDPADAVSRITDFLMTTYNQSESAAQRSAIEIVKIIVNQEKK